MSVCCASSHPQCSSGRNASHPHMIIVRLIGGLGNQLFQYAAARRMALKSGLTLKLDVTEFGAYKRPYALRHFNIVEDFASPGEIRRLKRDRLGLLFQQVLIPRPRHTHLQERYFHFDSGVLDFRGPAYVSGYWQSEKYFTDVTSVIRAEYSLKTPPAHATLAVLGLIEAAESVSLHVRRGDYVSNVKARLRHGSCSLEYYRRAIAEIARRVRHPQFFVFSDDAPWAREQLRIDAPTHFVDHNGPGADFEDLRLMSRCRHHIIANSTFSWWGAWLGEHPGQVVIAPEKWFALSSLDARDICPARWLRL